MQDTNFTVEMQINIFTILDSDLSQSDLNRYLARNDNLNVGYFLNLGICFLDL